MDKQPRKKIILEFSEKKWDNTFQLMSWWKTENISNAKVMVIGAGALGNEVLKNLALLGIGHIVIVDFDKVEYSNLSRSVLFRESDSKENKLKVLAAAEAIKSINPNIKVKTINGDVTIDVGLGVYRRMDVIIGCLDNRLARLAINRHAFWMNKTWVDGAIENLSGQLNVYRPRVACYESGLSEGDWQNIKQRIGCPDIARRNASYGRVPTTPISSSIIAAMQVQEALKVVNQNEDKLRLGHTFYYEGMTNTILEFENTSPNEEVLSSDTYEPIIEAAELTSNSTIRETLEWIKSKFQSNDPVIFLNYKVVLEIVPHRSDEKATPLIVAFPKLSDDLINKHIDSDFEDIVVTKDTNTIDADFVDLNLRLEEIGIPKLDVLKVFIDNDFQYIELTGDKDYLTFL